MSKTDHNMALFRPDGALFPARKRKVIPHEFVLDAITELSPETRPMFGCLAVYIDDKIVFILRDKHDKSGNNGVWIAINREHHASLRREFPHMRSIWILGKKMTGWQVLRVDAPDFEKAALHACELVIARDPRIGRVPRTRRSHRTGAKTPAGVRERPS